MNENPPPLPPVNPSPSKTSALAVWSLVLGVFSLTCFSFLSVIPGIICGHKAMSAIGRSRGALTGNGLAVAGLVLNYFGILCAVFWLGLITAIAVPNFVKARDTAIHNACINNLRQIEAAKQQWGLENHKKDSDTPTAADLTPFLNGKFPACVAGGTYTIGSMNTPPTCSIPGHTLDSTTQ